MQSYKKKNKKENNENLRIQSASGFFFQKFFSFTLKIKLAKLGQTKESFHIVYCKFFFNFFFFYFTNKKTKKNIIIKIGLIISQHKFQHSFLNFPSSRIPLYFFFKFNPKHLTEFFKKQKQKLSKHLVFQIIFIFFIFFFCKNILQE